MMVQLKSPSIGDVPAMFDDWGLVEIMHCSKAAAQSLKRRFRKVWTGEAAAWPAWPQELLRGLVSTLKLDKICSIQPWISS